MIKESMTTPSAPISKAALWTGYIMTVLPSLLMVFSAVTKLVKAPVVMDNIAHAGIPESHIIPLGIVELTCTVVYLIPRTSVLGAILLTGYLGGAIATTTRLGEGFILQVILGVVIWGGLFLRDPRLRALIPLRS
jgi:hypothetical protein